MLAAGRPVLLQPFTVLHRSELDTPSGALNAVSTPQRIEAGSIRAACSSSDTLQACKLSFNIDLAGHSTKLSHDGGVVRLGHVKPTKLPRMVVPRAKSFRRLPYGPGNGPEPNANHKPVTILEEASLPDWTAVKGWRMIVEATGVDIGYVQTALERSNNLPGCPVLRVHNVDAPQLFGEAEIHLIPFARPLVLRLDYQTQSCYIDPPEGLLELGRNRTLLAYLSPILQEVAKADAKRAQRPCKYMPSICSLVASGHSDIVPLIEAAGGFFQVAQSLSLRTRRKPPGFWDNEESLDEEIGQFVADSWTEHRDQAASDTYFYNQVTSEVRWEQPVGMTVVDLDDSGTLLRAEPSRSRVMPSQAQLAAAGRWDLHHAILYSGGYSEVAKLLGRRPPRRGRPSERSPLTIKSVAAELRAFQQDTGKPTTLLPSARVLIEAGRSDLLQAVRALGGYHAVAKLSRLNASRRPKGYWLRFETAVAELRSYLASHSRWRDSNRLPTHKELLEDGRPDLRYAMQLHSHHGLADALQLQGSAQGGHNHRKLPRSPLNAVNGTS